MRRTGSWALAILDGTGLLDHDGGVRIDAVRERVEPTQIRPFVSSPRRDRGKERRMSQPVSFDLERPVTFDRAHVFLRGSLLIVIGWIAHPIDGRYPESLWRFLLGIVRWEACLLAYLASLVDHYRPFTLGTGSLAPPGGFELGGSR